jgi:hypothetical protein
MLLEIVEECHRKHIVGTYEDDLVRMIHVIFEEDRLDVNRQYPLKEIHENFVEYF